MNSSCCCHQVLSTAPYLHVCNITRWVHPQSTEKLVWTATFHEWIQFCHGCWEYGSFDFYFCSQQIFHVTFPSFEECSCNWAENTFMPPCEDPSSLFRWEASGNSIILKGLVSGQNWSVTGCDKSCLASFLRTFTSPFVWKHIWKTCSNTETVFYSATIYLPQKASVSCMHCRGTVEIFLRVLFDWDLLQFVNGLLLDNLMARSCLKTLNPTNSSSCEGHIVPIFRTNLEILPTTGQDSLFPFRFHLFQKDHLQKDQ